jgi:transcriptional regulator MraZ
MFGGEHYTTIDSKGRTSLPAKLRETAVALFTDERFVITKCPVDMGDGVFGRGLAVYPYREWQALQAKIEQGGSGLTSAQINSIRRLILAPASECIPDKQGRVMIPPNLRGYAALERDIVFVGTQQKIEVWNLDAWDRVCSQAEKDFPVDTAALAELGL